MGHSSRNSFPHGEGVSTDEIRAWSIWIIQGVEEERRGGRKQVSDMLFQGIDICSGWVFSHKAIIIDSVDVLIALCNLQRHKKASVQLAGSTSSTGKVELSGNGRRAAHHRHLCLASARSKDFRLGWAHSPCIQSSGMPSLYTKLPRHCRLIASLYLSGCEARSRSHRERLLCDHKRRPYKWRSWC